MRTFFPLLPLLLCLSSFPTSAPAQQSTQNSPRINQFPALPVPPAPAPTPSAEEKNVPITDIHVTPWMPPVAPSANPQAKDPAKEAIQEVQSATPDLTKMPGLDLQKLMEMAKAMGSASPTAAADHAGNSTGTSGASPLGMVSGLLASPIFKKVQQLALDKPAQEAIVKVAATPNRVRLIVYDLIFIVMMFFLKNYELSRLEKGQFGRRIWVSVWSTTLNFVGLGILIPFIFFGQPYIDLIQAIGRIFFS